MQVHIILSWLFNQVADSRFFADVHMPPHMQILLWIQRKGVASVVDRTKIQQNCINTLIIELITVNSILTKPITLTDISNKLLSSSDKNYVH